MTSPEEFAHECRIRDLFAAHFADLRSDERIITREHRCGETGIRADLYTVDKNNLLREWEFKINAEYKALGQILTYVAMTRKSSNFTRTIRGVIAAFDFQAEVRETVEIMNLGIELVSIPNWMAQAGKTPFYSCSTKNVVLIPQI